MEKEDIPFLRQLSDSFEEAAIKLEHAYKEKDYVKFGKVKKIMLQIQKKISELVK